MRRDPIGVFVVVGLIVLTAALAGVTRSPDAAWVRALSRAAVIGPWVDRFAGLYRRPRVEDSARRSSDDEDGPEIVYELNLERYEARPRVWVEEGAGLFEEPSSTSSRLATVPITTNLRLLEQRDDWYRVRYKDETGWVSLPGYRESTTPPLGSDPEPPLPVPARSPDPEVLAEALNLLKGTPEVAHLGPYALYTDVLDSELLLELSKLVERLEQVYMRRYGLTPLAGVAEAVVLFTSREGYLEFQAASPKIGHLAAPGLVRSGVVATYVGERSAADVTSTVIHELTHLVNRRALGPALPPWLDEGLADDIGQSRIEGGRLLAGQLGGSYVRRGTRIEFKGGRAAAVELQRAMEGGLLLSVEALVALDWTGFQASERSLHYGHASFFVRSLLDSPDRELARRFRAFLLDVSRGQPLTPESLSRRLGRPWSELDRRLASFVRLQAVDGLPGAVSDSSSRQATEPSA